MTTKAKFDFYRVDYKEDKSTLPFDQVIENLIALSSDERQEKIDGEDCLFSQSLKKRDIVALLFTRVRMDGLPEKTKLTGARAPLDLDDDEGLGEDVVIAYSHRLKVLAVQRNIHSLSINSVLRLIRKLVPGCEVELRPILMKDALERMQGLKELKKFRIKIDATKDLSFLEDIRGFKNKVREQLWFGDPFLDITVSTGRKNCPLSDEANEFIKGIAAKLKGGEKPESLCNLEITGKEADEKPSVVIDLLEDRFVAECPVESKGRSVNPQALLKAAIDVIAGNLDKPELQNS